MMADTPEADEALRREAEARLSGAPPAGGGMHGPLSGQERALLHELQVHQVELALQNAQLREARDALEAAVARYRGLYDSAPVGDLVVDPAGTILAGNPAAAALLRLPPADLGGRRLAPRLDAVAEAAVPPFLRRVLTGDGVHHLEATIDIPPAPLVTVTLHASPEPSKHEVRVILVDTTAVHEADRLAAQARALEAEQRRLEAEALRAEQGREAQKMEALGVMAGGIAHDFNNHLAAILGYAAVARHEAGVSPAVLQCLDSIEHAGRQATEVVRRILTFSRQAPRSPKPVDLARVVRDALRLLEVAIPREVAVALRVAPAVPPVLGDETELHQVVLNLCTNALTAVAATPGGSGTITITVGTGLGGEPLLAVHDTGVGMDEATRARIFEPFFTTQASGAGTGLGLAVVHGIVQAHGGRIAVHSTPGAGSTFSIRFPAPAAA
jgi:signal transduction histidine kinase